MSSNNNSNNNSMLVYALAVASSVGVLVLARKSMEKRRQAAKAKLLRQENELRDKERERMQSKIQGGQYNRKRTDSEILLDCERDSVTVQVPGTSANIGSGYDCLGMAVDLWNELTVERRKGEPDGSPPIITVEGEGADDIPLDESNLVVIGIKSAYKAAGKPVPALKYHLKQRIPHGRGLGSSSAAIVAGILAGLTLSGTRFDVHHKETLLQLATEIEGHPDNVSPCIYGGVQIGIYDTAQKRWSSERVNLPHGIICVMFIPNFVGKTSELRKVVPKEVSMSDAVFNMSRVAWLIHALQTGKLENLRAAFEDKLHQPQRSAVYKHLYPIIDASVKAGAIGAYLSGAGPTIMSFTAGGSGDFFTQSAAQRTDRAVARAMQETADKLGIEGKVYVTHPSNVGGVVVRADPPFSTTDLVFNGET